MSRGQWKTFFLIHAYYSFDKIPSSQFGKLLILHLEIIVFEILKMWHYNRLPLYPIFADVTWGIKIWNLFFNNVGRYSLITWEKKSKYVTNCSSLVWGNTQPWRKDDCWQHCEIEKSSCVLTADPNFGCLSILDLISCIRSHCIGD